MSTQGKFVVMRDAQGRSTGCYYSPGSDQFVIQGRIVPASMFRSKVAEKPKPTIQYRRLYSTLDGNVCWLCYKEATKSVTIDTVDAGRQVVLECSACGTLMRRY